MKCDNPRIETTTLTRQTFAGRTAISIPEQNMRRWIDKDEVFNALVYQLEAHIFGQNIKTVTVRYPRDWREAIKERFAPAWFTRRWPVRYEVTTIDVLALYPTFTVPQHEMYRYVNIKSCDMEGAEDEVRQV